MALLGKKVDRAIERIRFTYDAYKSNVNNKPAFVAYSGGKDSTVVLELVKRSGIPFEAHYSITSVDPPELVAHIKSQKEVSCDIPRYSDGRPITMWNLIPLNKMPPTRLARYCCAALKEPGGKGSLVISGVRWAESKRRADSWGVLNFSGKISKNKAEELGLEYEQRGKNRFSFEPVPADEYDPLEDMIDGYTTPDEKTVMLNSDNSRLRRLTEYCVPKAKTMLNPIIDWSDSDVWNFIFENSLPVCELYAEAGKGGDAHRLGCIGCPMSGRYGRIAQLNEYPKYKNMYLKSFDKMLEIRKCAGLENIGWDTSDDVMEWWLMDRSSLKDTSVPDMFDYDITESGEVQ